jgi:hypothetical protein
MMVLVLATVSMAQDSPDKTASDKRADRNRESEESSSRDARIDISPPKDDAKNHPGSRDAVADFDADVKDKPDESGVRSSIPGTR